VRAVAAQAAVFLNDKIEGFHPIVYFVVNLAAAVKLLLYKVDDLYAFHIYPTEW
jgi:hypothetical protein